MGRKIIHTNRKAFHDYTIHEKYIAGIVLTGTEIKSVRKNAVNLKDSFARVEKGEVWLYGCHISPYEQGNRYNHKPDRVRKLLLNRKEILKLEIARAKGKKLYDKRESIAKKGQNRDIQRQMKRG